MVVLKWAQPSPPSPIQAVDLLWRPKVGWSGQKWAKMTKNGFLGDLSFWVCYIMLFMYKDTSNITKMTFFIISLSKRVTNNKRKRSLVYLFWTYFDENDKNGQKFHLSNATPPPQMIQCSPNLAYSMPLG